MEHFHRKTSKTASMLFDSVLGVVSTQFSCTNEGLLLTFQASSQKVLCPNKLDANLLVFLA